MKIWIDGDACPVVIREILVKAAKRSGVELILVANRALRFPGMRCIQVAAGLDVADNEIIRQMGAGDLVITADIPLAAKVVEKQGWALNPRGELYTKENIGARLSMRDFLDELRAGGIETGGPPALSKNDRQAFANQLDRLLRRHGPELN